MSARLVVVMAVALASGAGAQGIKFQGLDLSRPRKPAVTPVAPVAPVTAAPGGMDAGVAPADLAEGEAVIAVPPTLAQGRVDTDAYLVLHAALRERLGARVVKDDRTLSAIAEQGLELVLADVDGQLKLSSALKAELMVGFERTATHLTAKVRLHPGAEPVGVAAVALAAGRKLLPGTARALVAQVIAASPGAFDPPLGLDLTPAPPPTAPEPQYAENVEAASRPTPKRVVEAEPLAPAALELFAGAGTSFRALEATSRTLVVPRSPLVMGALGVDVRVFPFRALPSWAATAAAGLWVEGHYRANLVQASVDAGGTSTTCPVTDDEVVGRVGYRQALRPGWPEVGATVGLARERTLYECGVPALSTGYGSAEFHLSVRQPLQGQAVALEVGLGPRLLLSRRAAGLASYAFSGEAWLTARPTPVLSVRGGARVTGTKLTSWPDGSSVFDVRTFVGLEVGAAL